MATATSTSFSTSTSLRANSERRHRLRLHSAWVTSVSFLAGLAVYGYPYYALDLASRAASPYHPVLRPSGLIGLRLGMLGTALFAGLFLYPIRKRWDWLNRIGTTRHWLDFHVLLGVVAPVIVTFHASFKFGGLAGVAYWIMIAVALSGFVGRYLYGQIPRALNTAELSRQEMEGLAARLAAQLAEQTTLSTGDIAPVLRLPSRDDVERMSIAQALWTMLRLDLARPLRVSRLRRKFLSPAAAIATLGGLLPSNQRELESIVSACRSQSWISTKMLFLSRIQGLFHLWHIVHRPFSYSFAALVMVHIGVVILLGYF